MPPKGRNAAKAGAAFGRLNALSASGKLAAINNAGAQGEESPAAAVVPAVTDPAPAPSADVTRSAEAAEAAPVVPAPSAEAGPDAGLPVKVEDVDLAPPLADKSATATPTPDDVEETPKAALPSQDSFSQLPAAPAAPVVSGASSLSQVLLAPRGASAPQQEATRSDAPVAVRRTAPPALPRTSGYSEQRMLEALPPQLAEKVDGLPVAYLELAKSYRRAQATRTGTKPSKRNIRLHNDVATAVNRQLVSDKRMLGLKNLKPSQYVDAAITLAKGVSVEDLISAADGFRDSHIGEEDGYGSPNHYSIAKENNEWLDEMMDELLLANTTGLHGHMINVILQSFLEQLKTELPAEA
ncbi:hypothetical protein ACH41H_24330 [Streptomyces sp. NPDC020800]|uniref:hypothetical protein n=1 Tax=Streptomyces sp. NPDC020800 TaxID=3365092 RepID=UPI0037AD052C